MIYKGYTGVTEVDEDSGELFGHVIGLRDVVTFVGRTVEEARKSFEESVDYYLKSCQESGKEPDRPFSGQFLVRVDSETHRRLAILAEIHKLSFNEMVEIALKEFASENRPRAEEEVMALWSSGPDQLRADQNKAAEKAAREAAVRRSANTAKNKKSGKTGASKTG